MNYFFVLALSLVLLNSVNAFSPTSRTMRQGVRGSTVVMDGKTRDLRDRIKSIKQTRRITEAMRLVAAARVRRAQEAVLKSRPLIAQLQLVSGLGALLIFPWFAMALSLRIRPIMGHLYPSPSDIVRSHGF
jgi:F-type H+-transporting ATPase subunit gamma